MSKSIPEPCFTCGHFIEGACQRRFQVHIILADGRGSLRLETVPGSIPKHLEPQVQQMLTKVFGRFLNEVILANPVWKEIAAYQEESPERATCPARQARKDMGPSLTCIPGGKPLEG